MKTWAGNVWFALKALGRESFIAGDQLLNAVVLGALGVVMAMFTGARQAVAFSDETLSAHAWRSWNRGRLWGVITRPLIDFLFSWQKQDEEVNEAAQHNVSSHCERAYWKERLRRDLPPEYRDPPEPAH